MYEALIEVFKYLLVILSGLVATYLYGNIVVSIYEHFGIYKKKNIKFVYRFFVDLIPIVITVIIIYEYLIKD